MANTRSSVVFPFEVSVIPCKIVGISVYRGINATPVYLQFFDKTSAIGVEEQTPMTPVPIDSAEEEFLYESLLHRHFDKGCRIGISSTPTGYEVAANSGVFVTVTLG